MLRRAVCETASVRLPAAARVARPRAWGTARRWGSPFGVRRLLGFALAGSSRAVASLLRRAGADVCRLHVRSPGPWLGIPAHSLRLCAGMPAGSLCDAGLTRRAPGTRPPTLRHGPPGLASDLRSDEGRRRRSRRRRGSARWSIALSLPFCLLSSRMSPCSRSGRGSAHVCAALCRSVDLFAYITTYVAGVKSSV